MCLKVELLKTSSSRYGDACVELLLIAIAKMAITMIDEDLQRRANRLRKKEHDNAIGTNYLSCEPHKQTESGV